MANSTPKVGGLYEVHWVDIESLGDWNDDPERLDAPVFITHWYLVKPFRRTNVTTVFASTLDPRTKKLHDHQLIPTGTIMLIAQGRRVIWKHPKYIRPRISTK